MLSVIYTYNICVVEIVLIDIDVLLCVHLFPTPRSVMSHWLLEMVCVRSIYTTEIANTDQGLIYYFVDVLWKWCLMKKSYESDEENVDNTDEKCVLSVIITLWTAQKIEDIFFQ